jgi:cyclophilin family peptidyl-prolyl cis-trans isomerase
MRRNENFLILPSNTNNNMRRILMLSVVFILFLSLSCSSSGQPGDSRVVLISTDMGDIKVKLYDETPEHRDNFIKLAGEGFFDGLLFHRVIKNFMVQGGDPESRNAEPGSRLGGGGPGYTLPAEIHEGFFHKKGALAAARQGDQVNPERKSSGSQFYIVQGKVWRPGELDTMEMQRNAGLQQSIFRKHFEAAQEELNRFRTENNEQGFNVRVAELREEADSIFRAAPQFRFSEAQRIAYTTIGGYPSLDNNYTVFGEVIEGLEVIDKIAAVETGTADRPVADVKMKVKVLK